MSVSNTISIIGITLYLAVLVVHIIGFALLLQIKSSKRFSATQRLCLLNLSVIEICFCLSGVIIRLAHLSGSPKLDYYLLVITGGGLILWYVLVMAAIAVDRFLAVYFDIHYRHKWPYVRSKIALVLCFLIVVVVVINLFASSMSQGELFEILQMYVWPSEHAFLFIVVVLTYGYLFKRIRYYRRQSQRKGSSVRIQQMEEVNELIRTTENLAEEKKSSFLRRFQNSVRRRSNKENIQRFNKVKRGFFLPNLLIATFILFWTLPDIVYFGCRLSGKSLKERSTLADSAFSLLYILALFCDAIIYIFGVREVRYLLFKRMKVKR